MSEILNTITIDGPVFSKANIYGIKYVKLIPCYDVEYGIVLRVMMPTPDLQTLDKRWIKIEFSSAHDVFRFNCPGFLKQYSGSSIKVYEDEISIPGELCKIRRSESDFSDVKYMVWTPKATYHPWFSSNGRLHISLAYARNNFSESAKKEPYAQVASSIDTSVINRKIMVSVFSGKYLRKGELAFKLKRYEHELVTPPINVLVDAFENGISNFKYKKHINTGNVTTIHTVEEIKSERPIKRTGRRVCGARERAQRARRERDASRRAEAQYRREKGIFDFKRK